MPTKERLTEMQIEALLSLSAGTLVQCRVNVWSNGCDGTEHLHGTVKSLVKRAFAAFRPFAPEDVKYCGPGKFVITQKGKDFLRGQI